MCTTSTVRHKAEVQSKSQRGKLFSDMSLAPLAAVERQRRDSMQVHCTEVLRTNPWLNHASSGTEDPLPQSPPPPCDIPSGCCFFTGPWTVTRSSLRMLRRVAAFCRPLRPVLPLVSFPRSRSPVVGVLGLCWMWRDVPFARQRRPVVGVPGVVLVVAGVV